MYICEHVGHDSIGQGIWTCLISDVSFNLDVAFDSRCVRNWHNVREACLCDMGWLRLVGSLKLQVSFAEYSLFHRALLQERPIILRSLLIVDLVGLWPRDKHWPCCLLKKLSSPFLSPSFWCVRPLLFRIWWYCRLRTTGRDSVRERTLCVAFDM